MLTGLSACAVDELPPSEQEDESEPAALEQFHQPRPGVYSSSNSVSGFPLGSCGFQGSREERDSELNNHNSPYVMEWVDDNCVTIRDNPERCRFARDESECQGRKTAERKIAFPMDFSGANSCLTDAQEARLPRSFSQNEIGTVTMIDTANPSSQKDVGTLKIFRQDDSRGRPRYQYEMVAYGGRPFDMLGKSSLNGMKMCVNRFRRGLELPRGKTLLSCARFEDEARAQRNFGATNTNSTAFSFYDVKTHAYCPVAFAPHLTR